MVRVSTRESAAPRSPSSAAISASYTSAVAASQGRPWDGTPARVLGSGAAGGGSWGSPRGRCQATPSDVARPGSGRPAVLSGAGAAPARRVTASRVVPPGADCSAASRRTGPMRRAGRHRPPGSRRAPGALRWGREAGVLRRSAGRRGAGPTDRGRCGGSRKSLAGTGGEHGGIVAGDAVAVGKGRDEQRRGQAVHEG